MRVFTTSTKNVYQPQVKTPIKNIMPRPNYKTGFDKVAFSGFTAPREREINIIRQQLSDNDLIKLGRDFYAEHLTEKINTIQKKIPDNKRIAEQQKLAKGLGLDTEKKSFLDFLKPSTILKKREEAKKLAPLKSELKNYLIEYYDYKREKAIMQEDLLLRIVNWHKNPKDFIYPNVDEKFSKKLINHILKALPDNLKTVYKDSDEFELSRDTRDQVADIIHNSTCWTDLKSKFISNFLATPEEKKSIYDGLKQELSDMEKISRDLTHNGQPLFEEEDIKMLSDNDIIESMADSFLLDKYKGKDSFKL